MSGANISKTEYKILDQLSWPDLGFVRFKNIKTEYKILDQLS